MKVVEQFFTLQGEGRYVGVPSFFVRTTGCNLRCAWKNIDGSTTICDTPYSSFYPEKGVDLSAEEILEALKPLATRHVVITGGEPTLQPDLQDVVSKLCYAGYLVTIETNGTKFVQVPNAFMSISPKLSTSYAQPEGSKELRLHSQNNTFKEALKKYLSSNDCQVKFVYNDKADEDEIVQLQEELGIPSSKVYLMPQGITTGQFESKAKEMFGVCMRRGYNYSPRLHIDVWGNKRGV